MMRAFSVFAAAGLVAASAVAVTDAERTEIEDRVERRLAGAGVAVQSIKVERDGLCSVDLVRSGIVDLSVLRRLPISSLTIAFAEVEDLSPLSGLPLRQLVLWATKVKDLRPLRYLRLRDLNLNHCTELSDVSPLKGMRLRRLHLAYTGVSDLSPLAGTKLTEFSCGMAPVTNLLPLAGMPLERLSFSPSRITLGLEAVRKITTLDRIEAEGDPRFWELGHLPAGRFWRIVELAEELEKAGLFFNKLDVTDGGSIRLDAAGKDWKSLRSLKGLPIEWLDIAETGVVDLAPLRGMPLAYLNILETSIEDVSALEGMPLEDVRFNPNRVTGGLDFLRGMKTLVRIGTEARKSMPPYVFWQRYDSGHFRRALD